MTGACRAPRALALAALLTALVGCSSWPPHGSGGMAEVYWSPPAETNEPDSASDDPARRLATADRRLRDLAARGAEAALPAAYRRARIQWVRCVRELAGGLRDDAVYDLDKLGVMLSDLEQAPPPAAAVEVAREFID